MTHTSLLVVTAAAVLAGCTVAPPGPAPVRGYPRASPVEAMLRAHNAERAAVGVPPLAWDPALAADAHGYARELARLGMLRHSNRAARGGQGENLWMSSRGTYAPEQMVIGWASEKRAFRPGIFPAVSRTGNWADVGHYTQMIWRGSQRLGCGVASSPRLDFLVCRYAPAGNVDGRRVP